MRRRRRCSELVGVFGGEDGHFGELTTAPVGENCGGGDDHNLGEAKNAQNGFAGKI